MAQTLRCDSPVPCLCQLCLLSHVLVLCLTQRIALHLPCMRRGWLHEMMLD